MKKVRWVVQLFTVVGVGELIGGIYSATSTSQFLTKADKAAGVVVENIWTDSTADRNSSVSGTYHPRVRFRTRSGRDMEFVSSTGSSPAAYRENEGVTVLYDPEDPGHAEIDGFLSVWLLPVLLIGMGSVFAGGGTTALVWMRRRRQLGEWLRVNGQRIETTFKCVEWDTSSEVNGAHPYQIVSQWLNPRTNQVHVFKSDNIWYDPAQYVGGRPIGVRIDPNNPKRYAMDTDFLPQLAE
jgi:hypothetical protein